MKFLVPIDLNKNEVRNARIQNLATAPLSPVAGQIYFDTNSDQLNFWDGTQWVNAGGVAQSGIDDLNDVTITSVQDRDFLVYDSGSSAWVNSTVDLGDLDDVTINAPVVDNQLLRYDNTLGYWVNWTPNLDLINEGENNLYYTDARADGRIAAASIDDLSDVSSAGAESGEFLVFDGTNWSRTRPDVTDLESASGDYSFGGNKITNLATPTASSDAATKGYVDGVAQGLDVKQSVRVLSDSDIGAISSTGGYYSGLLIDGTVVNDGDRVLAIGQTDPSQNGIWVADSASASFVRAEDADTGSDLTAGSFVFVEEGNDYADTGWVLSTDNPVTVGTTAQTWVQFSGAGTYTAGTGLTLSGSEFSITPGGVTATEIATGAVDTDELATNAVTDAKIADNAVLGRHINFSINEVSDVYLTVPSTLADGTGYGIAFEDGVTFPGGNDNWVRTTIGTAGLSDNAVTTAKIENGAVTTDKLDANAVTNGKLADNAVQTENIVDGDVTEAKLDTTLANKINAKTDKVTTNVGDGSATSFAIAHGFGEASVTVYENATNAAVFVDVVNDPSTAGGTVTVSFATAPASNAYRVVIVG